MGKVTGIATIFQCRMNVGSGGFIIVALIASGSRFRRRHMRVVTFLALIFLKSGMFISPIDNLFVTSLALSNRSGL